MKREFTDLALPERLPRWGVLVLESHHSPEFTMEWRTHPFVKLVYVLSGKGTFHLGQQTESFATGDVIVVAPGTRNRIEDDPSSASSLYVCCIATSLLQFESEAIAWLATRVLRGDGHFANRVASLLRRMVHAQEVETPSRSIALVADAMKLVHAVCQRTEKSRRSGKDSPDERAIVQRYIETLPSQFFDESTIDAAASQLGIRRRTFTKLFTEATGETWLNHLRRLAIEHARRRLRQTDLPITSVAFECGFNDLSTFYRQFKHHCGTSPGKYRAQVQSDQSPIR